MVTGLAERWGDVEALAYGLTMLGICWWGQLRIVGPGEEALPVWARTGPKAALAVTLLAFGLNYTQTPFFFDVLHMHYGFGVTWVIAHNPIFLYLVSAAYFGTYFALCNVTFRWLRARWTGAVGRSASWVVAPLGMAFLETALNANPFTTRLFCYDELPLMLTFGTLAYGVAFVYALPVWIGLDEAPSVRRSAGWVAVGIAAACYADLLTLDLLRFHVAPHLTVVEPGADNLNDPGPGSCLAPR
jgi:hypothetical protein